MSKPVDLSLLCLPPPPLFGETRRSAYFLSSCYTDQDEMDEIEEYTTDNVVNLDDDSPDIDIVVQDRDIGPMNRDDVDPETINNSVLRQRTQKINIEHNILLDGDIDDDVDEDDFDEGCSEDDTPVDYRSEEEQSMDEEEKDDQN